MFKRRLLSLTLVLALVVSVMPAVFAAGEEGGEELQFPIVENFADMYKAGTRSVPAYSAAAKKGFVSRYSGAIMPPGEERSVATSIFRSISDDGVSVTEQNGNYLSDDANRKNHGGLIYRADVPPGAYHLEVVLGGGCSRDNTLVQPTGMEYDRIRRTSAWDDAGNVARNTTVTWTEGNTKWSYDFATGQDFVEIEIEPAALPTRTNPQTVTVKSISITPIDPAPAGEKATIFILGGSTEKSYTNESSYSSWGQVLEYYIDPTKVADVVNYSMGGRSMKRSYNEGRFNDILLTGKTGDYVFLTSAQGDEADGHTRFDRGLNYGTPEQNNALYKEWLDMYITAIKARGMHPILVSAVPRGNGFSLEGADKPNGFNPDSTGIMRETAKADPEVGYIGVYEGVKDYVSKLGENESKYIFSSYEAGETPAENSANGVSNWDGTTYKESAAKQFARIIIQYIYDEATSGTDEYTSKEFMETLLTYLAPEAQEAAKSGDWTGLFPEMAADVSQVDVAPGATAQPEENYYYRDNIERILRVGAMHKNNENLFKPNDIITVGEFARGMETVFGLDEGALESYNLTYAQLQEKYGPEVEAQASAADAAVPGEGQHLVTVSQSEGGTITIYNDSKFDYVNVDVKEDITAGGDIADNNYMKVTAPQEQTDPDQPVSFVKGFDSSAAFDNNDITGNYIEMRNSTPEKHITYFSKAKGKLVVYARFDDNKYIDLTNNVSGTVQSKYLNDTANGSGQTIYGTVEFDVEQNTEYTLWAHGGTGRLFGLRYYSLNYPQSTESLAVDDRDEIRITAVADPGYLNGEIYINGEPVTNEKEYSLYVDKDITVSATYIKEPEFVDTGAIASDAALTREAMGAILYDAYLAKFGKDDGGAWNKVEYMTNNGGLPAPGDANYDQNAIYEGTPYFPLVGWGALTDKDDISPVLYGKVKEAYNLGLMRSEKGIERGAVSFGTELEPKVKVTRAKAAKTMLFAYILTLPIDDESQTLQNHGAETAEITVPNPDVEALPYRLETTPSPEPTPVITPSPTPVVTPIPLKGEKWDFNSIPEGTKYVDRTSKIANGNGKELTLNFRTVSIENAVAPSIAERGEGDNYLKFTDTGSGQDGYTYNPSSPVDSDVIVIEQDFNIGGPQKDNVLLRFYDKNNVGPDNSYSAGSDDGRAFEVKTGDGATLKLTDYFSSGGSDDNEKGFDYTISNFNFTPGKWFSLRVEYHKAENVVKVYTKKDGEEYALNRVITLAQGTIKVDESAIPHLVMTGMAVMTKGKNDAGETIELSVDNIYIAELDSDPQETATPEPVPTATPEPAATATPVVHDYPYEITNAVYGGDNALSVDVAYYGGEAEPKAKLIIGVYSAADILVGASVYDITGTQVGGLDFKKPESGTVKLFIWSGTGDIKPLSEVKIVE